MCKSIVASRLINRGFTSANGPNHIAQLSTTFAPSKLTLVNFAYPGGTTDRNIIPPGTSFLQSNTSLTPPIIRTHAEQVTLFSNKYPLGGSATNPVKWTAANSLFVFLATTTGNDIAQSYTDDYTALVPRLVTRIGQLFDQVEHLCLSSG
jgi:hypothetical protein